MPCPVVRPSIASTSALRSVVGGTVSSANPEKTTRPIRMPFGCFWTKARAASWATASRLGLTSVEHIERETSRARMIEVRAIGTLRTTCGRPAEMPSATSPSEQQRDRQVALPALPLRQHRAQERDVRVANGLLAPAPLAPPVHPEQEGNDEERQQRERPDEGHRQTTRPSQTIESAEPSASRSPPAAANRAVTSRGFLTVLNSRSIDL